MRKFLAIILSMLMVFAVMPMALVSAETIQTVVFTMDEGSAPTSWSTDNRYTVTPGVIDSGDETYGKVLQLGTFGDQGSAFQFPSSAINTEIGIPTKITLEMKAGANFNVENGMALIAGGTWYKVSNSFYTGTAWRTITIDLTENNTYYSNVSTALAKGITNIAFNKNKATSYILVDNVTVHTELFSENREEQAKPDAPVVESFTGSSVTLKAVENALYSIDGGATWQSSNTFTGLKAATDYSFVIKLKQSATHFESPVSDATIATTAFVYKWNLYSDYFTINSGATLKGGFNTAYKNDGTWFVSQNNQVGDTATLTSKQTVAPGIYSANLWARTSGARASINVFVNDVKVKSALNTYTNKGNNVSFALDENTITIEEESTVTLTVTTTTTGNLYLNALELAKIDDVVAKPIYKVTINGVEEEYKEGTKISLPALEVGYHYTDGEKDYNPGDVYEVTGEATLTVELNSYDVTIDGTKVATVAHGGTFTVPTPPTGLYYSDGNVDYYGGEEIVVESALELLSEVLRTKYVYTMDEGSRVEYASTANIGNGNDGATYEQVDGDYKLALKAKSDQYTYLKLPASWSAKPYYKPVSISFTATKTSGKNVAFRNLDFSDAIAGNNAATGNVYNVSTSITYLPTSYSFNVTEDMYGYRYISAKYYSDGWSAENPVYAYIDNLTITYEYDFDYVAPSIKLETLEGAQLRLNNNTGIRFTTEVDPDQIASYIEDGYTVEMGTLIAPADKLDGELTFETNTKIADVPFKSFVNNDYFEGNKIAGSIVNIRDKNYGREFVGRGYIKLTKDGETTTIYSETTSTRSIKYLANACKNHTAYYETLDEEYKEKVDAWAAAPDYGA